MKFLTMHHVEHHPVFDPPAHRNGNTDSDCRVTVDEIGSAVEWINNPHMVGERIAMRQLRFFTTHRMAGESPEQDAHDLAFAGLVDLRHEVVVLLFAHLQSRRLAECRSDQRRRRARCVQGNCEHRLVGCGRRHPIMVTPRRPVVARCFVHNGPAMFSETMPHRPATPLARLDEIGHARQAMLHDGQTSSNGLIAPWLERSWRRCLGDGRTPRQKLAFDLLPKAMMRRTAEANRSLTLAAQPVLEQLSQALATTGYFAILTNASGIVVDALGPIDHGDRRCHLITRIGVDLSESAVGTTAIGAALSELQPVWLHRGEHFFDDTGCYSCAGAPVFGPRGECVGMLDVTGVDAPERPELGGLVTQSARAIENSLTVRQPHKLLLRLYWPGHAPGGDADGLLGLDADGFVTTSNQAARQLLPALDNRHAPKAPNLHSSELFALQFEMLFDAARGSSGHIMLPLWSGLRLQAIASMAGPGYATPAVARVVLQREGIAPNPETLRDIETALIRKAVDEARGNVAKAAAQLGVSRATVYRKLGMRQG